MTSRLTTLVAAALVSVAVLAEVGTSKEEGPVLLGPLTREEIEVAAPDWVEAEIEAQPDLDAAMLLESSFAGGVVVVCVVVFGVVVVVVVVVFAGLVVFVVVVGVVAVSVAL